MQEPSCRPAENFRFLPSGPPAYVQQLDIKLVRLCSSAAAVCSAWPWQCCGGPWLWHQHVCSSSGHAGRHPAPQHSRHVCTGCTGKRQEWRPAEWGRAWRWWEHAAAAEQRGLGWIPSRRWLWRHLKACVSTAAVPCMALSDEKLNVGSGVRWRVLCADGSRAACRSGASNNGGGAHMQVSVCQPCKLSLVQMPLHAWLTRP